MNGALPAKVISRYDAAFTQVNQVVSLELPINSLTVALRVYRDEVLLTLFVLQEQAPETNQTYERTFMIIPIDDAVPESFKKYVATLPFGPDKIQTHIIEI